MSNKYLPEEDYQASGLLYKLPLGIGDAFQDAIIPKKVQEERLLKQNQNKLKKILNLGLIFLFIQSKNHLIV